MTRQEARRLIVTAARKWVEDPDSAVVWTGEHEGRPGIRMTQENRDFTTLWFEVGDRTVGLEAYLVPAPPHNQAEVYRQALVRNGRSWPVWIAAGRDGDLYVLGRLPLESLDEEALDRAVGGVYELVDIAFRPMIRAGFAGSSSPGG